MHLLPAQKKRDVRNGSSIVFVSSLHFGFFNRGQRGVEGKIKANEVGIYHVRKLKDAFFINASNRQVQKQAERNKILSSSRFGNASLSSVAKH